jgi:acetyl-CoA carboxylase carboxyl transferase subunit alpha
LRLILAPAYNRPAFKPKDSCDLKKHKKAQLAPKKKLAVPKGESLSWQKVQLARHPQRPFALDYIQRIFTDFQEIHGDRAFGDDQAIVTGFAFLGDQSVFVIGHQKGRDTKENIKRNFGMSNPEGYRKALRVMKMAEKFKKPVITFIDTPGAYPGLDGEERGQSEAIARNLLEMAKLRVPIIAVVTGEGGSGGALGIGVANKILILENSVYSVISPEGCAAILWNDRARMQEAAEAMKMTAPDLLQLKIVDEIVPEPEGGAHLDHDLAAQNLKKALEKNLKALITMSPTALEAQRYEKFRAMGVFQDK